MGKRNRTPKAAPVLSLRAQSRKLFPTQSRTFRAQWVLAKMRLKARRWQVPIGSEFIVDPLVPDFLRTLPRNDPAPLTIEPTLRDHIYSITRGRNHG